MLPCLRHWPICCRNNQNSSIHLQTQRTFYIWLPGTQDMTVIKFIFYKFNNKIMKLVTCPKDWLLSRSCMHRLFMALGIQASAQHKETNSLTANKQARASQHTSKWKPRLMQNERWKLDRSIQWWSKSGTCNHYVLPGWQNHMTKRGWVHLLWQTLDVVQRNMTWPVLFRIMGHKL